MFYFKLKFTNNIVYLLVTILVSSHIYKLFCYVFFQLNVENCYRLIIEFKIGLFNC